MSRQQKQRKYIFITNKSQEIFKLNYKTCVWYHAGINLFTIELLFFTYIIVKDLTKLIISESISYSKYFCLLFKSTVVIYFF